MTKRTPAGPRAVLLLEVHVSDGPFRLGREAALSARPCPACGAPLDSSDQRFCHRCGAALVAAPGPGPVPLRVGDASAQRLLLLAALAVVVVALVAALMAFVLSVPGGFSGIRVLAPAGSCWNGAIGTAGSMSSVEGCGPKDFPLACGGSVMGAILKDDAGSWTLTVEILSNGHAVRESSTSAPYGGVSVVGVC